MADPRIDLTGEAIPRGDGAINRYAYREAVKSGYFDTKRHVTFVNGMKNSGENHAEACLALSWVQMCTVTGVFNKSNGGFKDFLQCVADKNQFDGPASFSAKSTVAIGTLFSNRTTVEVARHALRRNPAQVRLFDHLRLHRRREVFAHSQGNLILSNVLQAIAATDGEAAIRGYKVHTFGSPAVNWPAGVTKYENGFTWDPVTFLAGFDASWSISKVGMPKGSLNPITHGFLEYLKRDPEFTVNRFRWGSLGVTFNMDEEGLAKCLAAMGGNTQRVATIFEHLDKKHNNDADDVAVLYVGHVKKSPALATAVKSDTRLVNLLVKVMDEGWTSDDEKAAIAFLKAK